MLPEVSVFTCYLYLYLLCPGHIMARVTPIIRKSKRDKSGRCPVWLRISDRDSSRYIAVNFNDETVKVLPSEWNPRTGRVRKSRANSDLINQIIQEQLTKAEAVVLQLQLDGIDATADQIKETLQPGKRLDFFGFWDRHLADLEERGKIGRLRRLRATKRKLEAFAGKRLPFDKLTPRLLTEFETDCLTKGNKQSTVETNLRDIKALVNRAIRERLIPPGESPFLYFKITSGQAPEREKLTFQEVQAIERLELEEGSRLWHARNVFLFAFYGAGIRFSDVVMMTAGKIISGTSGAPDRLAYRMGKNGKLQSVKITPPARDILKHYLQPGKDAGSFIFPMMEGYDLTDPKTEYNAKSSQNTLMNKALKEIARLASIDKPVTMHIARHSFADLARTKGWSIYNISKALRHSSVEMTERYLKAFDDEALDKQMDSLFGEVAR